MIQFSLPPIPIPTGNLMQAQVDPDHVDLLGVFDDPRLWTPWQPVTITWHGAEVDVEDDLEAMWCDPDVDFAELETTDPLLSLLDSDDTDDSETTWS